MYFLQNTKLSAQDEHVLPDTTVHPSSLDTVSAPRDPRTSNPLYSRTAGRDPHIKDPRLKGSPLPVQSSLVPHSTTPGGLPLPSEAAVPPPESAFIPVPPYSGPAGMPHYVGAFPPGIPGAIPPGIQPPFMQSGQLHINPGFLAGQHAPPPPVEGHFRGEVYHPDSSDDNDIKSQDSGPVSKSDNLKTKPKVPTTNRRDPRQARKEMEQGSHIDLDSNRSMRESARNNRDNVLDRNSYDRNSGRNSNRSSRDRDQRSRSPHSSSRSPRTSESGRDKSDSKSRDPRLKRHADDDRRKDTERSQDDRVGPNDNKHGSLQRNDDRRHSRDKSPERSPKYSKRSEKDRLDKGEDRSKHQKDMKRSSKERSASPSKHKVRNKNDNAKKSGSVERTDKSGKDVKVKTPKRELEKDDLVPVEDESLSKKAKIEPVDVKPIIEGADVLGKIQEDIR